MMINNGCSFIHRGRQAKTLHKPFWSDALWLCYYDGTFESFYAHEELIEKEIREMEEKKNKMNFEYKFYEKNLAPKWLEGDYDLHIEGNKMVMTSKDGKKVEARCHPDDDWRLQVGLDELKDRMSEAKKPGEIRVGDVVKVKTNKKYSSMDAKSFFEENDIPAEYIIRVVQTNAQLAFPSLGYEYRVLNIGRLSGKTNKKCALIESNTGMYLYVVDYDNLELVE